MKEQTKLLRRDLIKFSSVAMAGAYLAGAKALLATANETPTVKFHKAISYIEGEISAKTFPGAALLVVRRGEKLLERYWGTYCSVNDREAPLTAEVFHPLFSFSKVISATAIALAHQNRLLDYDAPIHTYIPEYRGGWKDLIADRKLDFQGDRIGEGVSAIGRSGGTKSETLFPMATRAITPANFPNSYAELGAAVKATLFSGQRAADHAKVRTYHETGRLIRHHVLAEPGSGGLRRQNHSPARRRFAARPQRVAALRDILPRIPNLGHVAQIDLGALSPVEPHCRHQAAPRARDRRKSPRVGRGAT